MKEIKTIRHGDIPLHKIDKLPEGLTKISSKEEHILAEGETTGHMHRLKCAEKVDMFTDTFGNRYVAINGKATVSHEEHKTLIIDPGVYRIGKEREKDWFSLSVKKVID